MDLNKLKVVELRAELQARDLDTKGVKAVLIDRLKEALDAEAKENEGGAPAEPKPVAEEITPSTPSRARRRSTRSRTKSPSPTRVIQEAPTLPSVTEEPQSEDAEMTPAPAEKLEKSPEKPKEPLKTPEKPKEPVKTPEPAKQPEKTPEKSKEESKTPVKSTEQVTPSEEQKVVEKMDVSDSQDQDKEDGDAEKSSDQAQTAESQDGDADDERNSRKRSSSPSSKQEPKKRQKLPPPNIDDFVAEEDEPEIDNSKIQMSWFDSDLNLKIDRTDFNSAINMSESGLALVWAGARANYGVKENGKYFYEVQISSSNDKIHYPNEKRLHEFRCGWSVGNTTNLQVGEFENSFGLDTNGKKCLNGVFSEYCNRFGLDDVIGVHLDLNDEKCKVQYTVNGKDCGVAFEFDKSDLKDEALFPHFITKNYGIKLNFGQLEESLWSKRRDGYKEREFNRRKNDQERKKKDFERKKEQLERRKADAQRRKENEERRKKEQEEKKKKDEEKPADEKENKDEDTEMKPDETPKENGEEKKEAIEDAKEEKTEETAEKTEESEPEKKENSTELEKKEEKPLEELVEPVWEEIKAEDIDAETPMNNQLEGFVHLTTLDQSVLVLGPQRPETRKDCEVLMLIGLPGAGKTHWAFKKCEECPEKRYTVLGTKFLLDKMKILGETRKPGNNQMRWEKLIELCNRGIQTLNDIAAKRRRNYILDQPHVYTSVQRRKMRVFGDFKRVAVIVVPEEEEYKKRFKERIDKEGKDLPDHTINELKANISLPELEYKWFDEILYSDLEGEQAKEAIGKENELGKKELNRRRRNDYGRGRDYGRNNRDQRWAPRDRWGPPSGQRGPPIPPPGFRRDFGYDNRDRRGGWGQDNWMNNNRSRGYGGAPPPRPGRRDDRDRDRRDHHNRDRRDYSNRSGGSSSNNRNDRRDDRGSSKNQSSKDWNSGANAAAAGQWGNNWNNYSQWNQQTNWAQDPSFNNATQDPQQWYQAYYQQQQQWSSSQPQNWYGGSQSYDTAKQ